MQIINTTGVCAKQIMIRVEDKTIQEVKFIGGCPGNAIGLANMVKGQKIEDVITKLEDVTCGNKSTSCPAQLAHALRGYL